MTKATRYRADTTHCRAEFARVQAGESDGAIVTGDCRAVLPALPDASVDLVITSPPFNVARQYDAFDDQLPWLAWYALLDDVLRQCRRLLRPGGVLALNAPPVVRWQRDHRHADTWAGFEPAYRTHRGSEKVTGKARIEPVGFRLFNMIEDAGLLPREPITWVKGAPGQAICGAWLSSADNDPFLRPACDWILLASKDRWFHDGGTGRREPGTAELDWLKDVWHVPPTSSNGDHPAPFPLEIPRRLIALFVHRCNTKDLPAPIILDPFMGSGTTALAAQQAGYRFFGCDLSPAYVAQARQALGGL